MDNLPVNIVDICVAAVLLLSALLGFMNGFVGAVLWVAKWVGAVFAAWFGFPYLQPYANDLISSELIAAVATGLGIFAVTLVVLSLFFRALARGVQMSALNALDRSLGFLFGAVFSVALICVAYIGVDQFLPPDDRPEWMTTARSMPLIQEGAAYMITLLPKYARERSAETAGEAAEQTRKLLKRETERTLQEMLSVEPKGTDAAPTTGYDKRTRTGIERLIDNSQ